VLRAECFRALPSDATPCARRAYASTRPGHDLIGISPQYEVHVAGRLLDDEDGPMLELLKGFHRQRIGLPRSRSLRPDGERLAVRFERFAAA
jgi:putative restriction endonuclease